MKKIIQTVLAASLALSLTACGSNNSSDSSSTPAADGTSAGQVTLKLSTWQTDAKAQWSKIIPEFEKANPDIKVELDLLNEKGDSVASMQKLDLMAASDDQLDIIEMPYTNYSQRASIGLLEPLDSYIEKEGYKYGDEYLVDTHVDGKIYALPSSLQRWFVLLNKDLLDAAQLPVPQDWTWADFEDYAKKLTKGEGASKVYGAYFHNWPDLYNLQLKSKEIDNNFLKADGTSNATEPLLKSSLKMLKTMMYTDKTANPYEDIISQKLHYRTQFFNGAAAMVPIGDWMVAESGGTDAIPATFHAAFAPIPKLEGKAEHYSPVQPTYMGVAAKSKNKEAAYKFVRWYTTEGLEIGGRVFSGWAKSDSDKLTEKIVSTSKDPSKVDMESLKYTMKNTKPGQAPVPVPYVGEVEKAAIAEVELYLLDKQDIDKTIESMDKKITDVINSNKK